MREKLIAFAVLFAILATLTSCKPTSESPSPDPSPLPAIVMTATPDPAGTPTPLVKTADQRSDFDRCAEPASGVVLYMLIGEDVQAVSVTWGNDTGGTNQGDYKVPFCYRYAGFEPDDPLYISAQIALPSENAGEIHCRIYDGFRVIAEAQAGGFASIATCSGRAQ